MINSIEQYLAELKKALSGSDRATVQDALADAEEYLRNAVTSQAAGSGTPAEPLAAIIEKYGTPEEVATAYKEIESRTPPTFAAAPVKEVKPVSAPAAIPVKIDTRPWIARFFGVFAEPRAWGSLFYLLFSLATGIIYFTWAITGISVSISLLILIVGLPIGGLFLLSVRGISLVEGRLVEALLGVRMPRRPLFSRRDISWWQKFKGLLTSRHTWTTLVYMILMLPLGIIYFTVIVTLVAVSAWYITFPIWQFAFGLPIFTMYPYEYYIAGWAMPLVVIGGIILLTATMHLAKITGRGHGLLAKALLVSE
jgi:hypothetical protein